MAKETKKQRDKQVDGTRRDRDETGRDRDETRREGTGRDEIRLDWINRWIDRLIDR